VPPRRGPIDAARRHVRHDADLQRAAGNAASAHWLPATDEWLSEPLGPAWREALSVLDGLARAPGGASLVPRMPSLLPHLLNLGLRDDATKPPQTYWIGGGSSWDATIRALMRRRC